MKQRLTKDQRAALKAYNFAVSQEDRYLGSVFVNAFGQHKHAAKVATAYAQCKHLGMDHNHGI